MKRFLLLWFVLASSWFVASLLLDAFTSYPGTLQIKALVTLLTVTAAQAAMLQSLSRFFRSKPDESPDQHR